MNFNMLWCHSQFKYQASWYQLQQHCQIHRIQYPSFIFQSLLSNKTTFQFLICMELGERMLANCLLDFKWIVNFTNEIRQTSYVDLWIGANGEIYIRNWCLIYWAHIETISCHFGEVRNSQNANNLLCKISLFE